MLELGFNKGEDNKMSINKTIKRGEIYYAKLNGIGNQQIGTRPVIIYSNNINNKFFFR